MEHSARSFVRTSFSDARRIDSFPVSRAPRSRSSSRQSCSSRSTVIGGRTAGLGGAEATGGANAGRNQGRKQGLAPDPTGEAAPLGASPENAVAVRWAVGAVCCGALGCREESDLLVVRVGQEERVLCADCVDGFAGGRSR